MTAQEEQEIWEEIFKDCWVFFKKCSKVFVLYHVFLFEPRVYAATKVETIVEHSSLVQTYERPERPYFSHTSKTKFMGYQITQILVGDETAESFYYLDETK